MAGKAAAAAEAAASTMAVAAEKFKGFSVGDARLADAESLGYLVAINIDN